MAKGLTRRMLGRTLQPRWGSERKDFPDTWRRKIGTRKVRRQEKQELREIGYDW